MAEVLKPEDTKTRVPIKLVFLHIEMPPGGSGLRLESMVVSYCGANTPVDITTMGVDARMDIVRVTDGKEIGQDNWWIQNLMSTLFGILPNPVAGVFAAARNGCAAGPILAMRQRHPGAPFIIRDQHSTPLLAFNQMLAEAGVPPVAPIAYTDLRHNSPRASVRSKTSRSIETSPRLLVPRYAELVSLAVDFFDLLEPHMEAGLYDQWLRFQEQRRQGQQQ